MSKLQLRTVEIYKTYESTFTDDYLNEFPDFLTWQDRLDILTKVQDITGWSAVFKDEFTVQYKTSSVQTMYMVEDYLKTWVKE